MSLQGHLAKIRMAIHDFLPRISLRTHTTWSWDRFGVFQSLGLYRLLTAGVTILALVYAVTAIYQAFIHPLARYPGPKSWAFSRLPLSWHFLKGDVWHAVAKLHARYGHTVRIAPNELSMISPGSWKEIYTSRPTLLKDPLSQTPPLKGADSLFTAVGDDHRRLRGVFSNSFSDNALREQLSIIEPYISQLMDRISRDASKNVDRIVDIQKLYGYVSLDIISELTSGEPQHGLEGSNEHSRIAAFFAHAKFSTFRSVLVHFSPLDKFLSALVLSLTARRREENWNAGFEQLNRRLTRGGGPEARSDLMTAVLEKVNEDKQEGITKVELLTNCLGFVIADCQLTTLTLTTATYLLIRNPFTLEHLVHEIRSGFEREKDITVQSTQSLPYLEAVISETLRIHHPTPITLPRVVPPHGRIIEGLLVPGNTIIGINLQVIQNSPEHWFEPRTFHPERFLSPDDPKYDTRFDNDNKSVFRPFSIGPRNCIGGKLFSAQAKLILARLVWNFDLELVAKDDWTWLDQRAWLAFEHRPLLLKATNARPTADA